MISLSDDKQADAIDAFNTTVHSRYLGSKKPLGGFYHYINIGSFFLMFLDKYGIKLYILDDFPINLCGVEDSVKNYQTYLVSCCAVMAFEFNCRILFFFVSFRFVTHISISHMIFMLNYAFTHILFSLRILLLAVD